MLEEEKAEVLKRIKQKTGKNGKGIGKMKKPTKKLMDLLDTIDKKEKETIENAKAQFALIRFEVMLSSIPEKERIRATNAVKDYRKEHWAKALKEAKGDANKAYDIYCKED